MSVQGIAVLGSTGSIGETLAFDDRGDELGTLSRASNAMYAYQRAMVAVADRMAAGDLSVEVRPRSSEDSLGIAFDAMLRKLGEVLGEVNGTASALSTAAAQLSATAQTVLDSFIVSQRADFQKFSDLLRLGRAARAAGRS